MILTMQKMVKRNKKEIRRLIVEKTAGIAFSIYFGVEKHTMKKKSAFNNLAVYDDPECQMISPQVKQFWLSIDCFNPFPNDKF